MMDDKDRKIQDLEAAIKVQAAAFKVWEAAEDRELNRLRKQEIEAQQALRQLNSERKMNAFLTGEVEGLRNRFGTDAATEERTKIVAWLMNEESDYRSTKYAEFVEIIRKDIEAGEHLK